MAMQLEPVGYRIEKGVERGPPVQIFYEGLEIQAYQGETVAGALLAAGIRVMRHAEIGGDPRGMFCGMGVCFDCRMMIDGQSNVRACITPVRQGMRVRTK